MVPRSGTQNGKENDADNGAKNVTDNAGRTLIQPEINTSGNICILILTKGLSTLRFF